MNSVINADFIAEELLETTGKALLCDDFERFWACFDLPLHLEIIDGARTITTLEEFYQVYVDVRRHMHETNVVDLERTVVSASFADANTIISVHVCNDICDGGTLVRPAYPVRSVLRRSGLRWKIVSCLYVILDSTAHNAAIVNPHAVYGQSGRLH